MNRQTAFCCQPASKEILRKLCRKPKNEASKKSSPEKKIPLTSKARKIPGSNSRSSYRQKTTRTQSHKESQIIFLCGFESLWFTTMVQSLILNSMKTHLSAIAIFLL